jgi:hypothetical protein
MRRFGLVTTSLFAVLMSVLFTPGVSAQTPLDYWRLTIFDNTLDSGYPEPVEGHWDELWSDRIDAVLNWGHKRVYLFTRPAGTTPGD